jgi:methyl-accepting chemotaxis protein
MRKWIVTGIVFLLLGAVAAAGAGRWDVSTAIALAAAVSALFFRWKTPPSKGWMPALLSRAPEASQARKFLEHLPDSECTPENVAFRLAEEWVKLENARMPNPSAITTMSMRFQNNIAKLLDEQSRLVQASLVLKGSTQDWASSLDKINRINKSILQLNHLIAGDSKRVSGDTEAAVQSASDGIKTVGREIKAMTELKATIGSSTEVIQDLANASEKIGQFVATITTIARKTNLLALNAGIEAARAGEHGQGFAVVASEIKTLAEASTKASSDVKQLVDDIRQKTANAISLIASTEKIEENINVVYSAGDVFMMIVKSFRKAGTLLGEISQALEDQRNDNELLIQLVERMCKNGDEVKSKIEDLHGRWEKLNEQSHLIRTEISQGQETPTTTV